MVESSVDVPTSLFSQLLYHILSGSSPCNGLMLFMAPILGLARHFRFTTNKEKVISCLVALIYLTYTYRLLDGEYDYKRTLLCLFHCIVVGLIRQGADPLSAQPMILMMFAEKCKMEFLRLA